VSKLVIELTDRCNLHCGHCPSGRHGGTGCADKTLLLRVFSEARGQGVAHVVFTGGEPTLHPDFGELIGAAVEAGLDFSFVTNGWSFPKRLPQLLTHAHRLRMITFSIDGARETTHDGLRGRGSYRRVLQAASVCVLRGLPFSFNMTLTRVNRGEIREMVALAKGLGALGVRFGHLMSDPHPAAGGLEMTPEERKSLQAELEAVRAESDFPVGVAPGGHTRSIFPCDPLNGREVNLDWKGRVGLCCHLSGFAAENGAVAGDLNAMGLADGLARLSAVRDDFKQQKQQRHDTQALRDDDYFPCWHCAKRFGGLEWMRDQPSHPWFHALNGTDPETRAVIAAPVPRQRRAAG
jgi:MoaA/NifB/PqqE/SkfB family radical SAM enzyme